MSEVVVIGAGAWGTALAVHCARAGQRVTLWARDPGPIAAARESVRLPGVRLPGLVAVSASLPAAADAVLLATPVQHLRAALSLPLPRAPLVLCMKGLEAGTHLFPAEVAGPASLAQGRAILTGPNFAHELARGLPAAAVLACADPALRRRLVGLLGTREYRLYGSADPVGAQVGGAAKNVIAIAAGAAIGAGLGENARAALVTRGVAEMARLAVALGGRAETVSGLSGLGDLMLTCAGGASRNFRLGLAIGAGRSPSEARTAIGAAVEGMEAAPALLARAGTVPCPIIAARRRRAGGRGERARRDGRAAGSSGSRGVAMFSTIDRKLDGLRARYAEPHRAYHTQAHVDTMLAGLRGLPFAAPAVAELAVWYHDAVYDPAACDNEARSAALMQADLAGLADPALLAAADAMIRATASHALPPGASADLALFLDLDMAVLGAAPDAYDAYERGIAAEYVPVYGEAAFRQGRAAFRQDMLARASLFHTAVFRADHEPRARDNLRRASAHRTG